MLPFATYTNFEAQFVTMELGKGLEQVKIHAAYYAAEGTSALAVQVTRYLYRPIGTYYLKIISGDLFMNKIV